MRIVHAIIPRVNTDCALDCKYMHLHLSCTSSEANPMGLALRHDPADH